MRIRTPCLIMLCTLIWPNIGLAADVIFNNGSWSATFDYGQECSQNGADPAYPVNCGLIQPFDDYIGNWNPGGTPLSRDGHYTAAVSAANNPYGDGGLGARFWNGTNTNEITTQLGIHLSQIEPEIWLRWYQRFEAGYQWGGSGSPSYDKSFYIWEIGPGAGRKSLLPMAGSGTWNIHPFAQAFPKITWADVHGNPSTGEWHMFEMHVKINTPGKSDGIAQLWIDGVRYINRFDIDYNGMSGMRLFVFESNQSANANSRAMYVDYDDIEIWRTTPPNISLDGDAWIGPINGFLGAGSVARPKSPAPVGVSFNDLFEDINFVSRGWYDKKNMLLANSGAISRSTKSIE